MLLDQARSLGRPGLIANSNSSVELCEEKRFVDIRMMIEISCGSNGFTREYCEHGPSFGVDKMCVEGSGAALVRMDLMNEGAVQALEKRIRGDRVCWVHFGPPTKPTERLKAMMIRLINRTLEEDISCSVENPASSGLWSIIPDGTDHLHHSCMFGSGVKKLTKWRTWNFSLDCLHLKCDGEHQHRSWHAQQSQSDMVYQQSLCQRVAEEFFGTKSRCREDQER